MAGGVLEHRLTIRHPAGRCQGPRPVALEPKPSGLVNAAGLHCSPTFFNIWSMSDSSLGTLAAIWIKRAKRGPMDAVETARLVAGLGIVGNANQGGKRQVTVMASEAWDATRADLGLKVGEGPAPIARRANLLTTGVDLADSRGRVLRVGDVRLRLNGETVPCHLMEETCAGLQEAMRPDWRGGAFGEVLDDGEIAPGDHVEWVEAP